MSRSIGIDDLMEESGVKFGTSGARGLATDMRDRVCYAYTKGFLQYLQDQGMITEKQVGIGGDLRPSTPRIMNACAQAVLDMGMQPVNYGQLPSPALAAQGLKLNMPTLMVTGSHIPDDRNGIKFNTPKGEILKQDERGIREQQVTLPTETFDAEGRLHSGDALPEIDPDAENNYVQRYLEFLPRDCLSGLRVGVYEHSGVGRDLLKQIFAGLGADVTGLGRAEHFIPVDTEAIREEDIELARDWASGGDYDCLVSTDGDADRPLVSNERGEWLRGDIAGILCARYLGAKGVVTPVSSNSALESSGWFEQIERTRIGSPFVIAGMQQLGAAGIRPVVGYEANGGFLTADDVQRDGRHLPALPTRDAVIVALGIMLLARERQCGISALCNELPARYTASDRIKDFPTELSRAKLRSLAGDGQESAKSAIETDFSIWFGQVDSVDQTDGLRIRFVSGEIVHLRPSGNAPELRAYTEADTAKRAQQMNRICMKVLQTWR